MDLRQMRAPLAKEQSMSGMLEATTQMAGNLSGTHDMTCELTIPEAYEAYDGSYTFTPTESTQTIAISGKVAAQNITINPIPSNYGRITWDVSTLTVS